LLHENDIATFRSLTWLSASDDRSACSPFQNHRSRTVKAKVQAATQLGGLQKVKVLSATHPDSTNLATQIFQSICARMANATFIMFPACPCQHRSVESTIKESTRFNCASPNKVGFGILLKLDESVADTTGNRCCFKGKAMQN